MNLIDVTMSGPVTTSGTYGAWVVGRSFFDAGTPAIVMWWATDLKRLREIHAPHPADEDEMQGRLLDALDALA